MSDLHDDDEDGGRTHSRDGTHSRDVSGTHSRGGTGIHNKVNAFTVNSMAIWRHYTVAPGVQHSRKEP